MKKLITLLSLIIAANVNAQSVEVPAGSFDSILIGRVACCFCVTNENKFISTQVLSAKDSSVLAGASVKTKTQSTITNHSGMFLLQTNAQDSITVGFIGYKDKIIAVKDLKMQKAVYLDEQTNELETVEIDASSRRWRCGLRMRVVTVYYYNYKDSTTNQPKIKLYPNPTSNYATFSEISNIEEIIVSDFNGKQLQRIANNNSKSLSINVSGYPAATYLVTYITKDKKRTTEKLVVIH